ncbi:unnamed protein product [Lepeophtheirus salmonis]|uniref:(salmon louse) hypothetical protein n=1 Tax=Lepeophtheirus salmonis TaxID=72036 RepID=A0A817FBM4_LEPSM|nr:unnamed protein product [Lepeophtheirus salmonis]CAG9477268.1 unnamed protein product [Lepeophtheirus salmonis]
MNPMERIHRLTGYSEEGKDKRGWKMVLYGHNLFNALRVACSSIRGRRSADGFSEGIIGEMMVFQSLDNPIRELGVYTPMETTIIGFLARNFKSLESEPFLNIDILNLPRISRESIKKQLAYASQALLSVALSNMAWLLNRVTTTAGEAYTIASLETMLILTERGSKPNSLVSKQKSKIRQRSHQQKKNVKVLDRGEFVIQWKDKKKVLLDNDLDGVSAASTQVGIE